MWSSRYYYDNCSHFGAYVAPQSSISTDAGVDYYILECRGPGLPLAGEFAKRNFPLADATGTFSSFPFEALSSFFSGSAFHGVGVQVIRITFNHHHLSIFLRLTGVHSAKTHRLIRVLYDTRKQFSKKLDDLALPSQRTFEVPLTHGTRAAVQILFPPSWREELRDAQYPVLVEV